MVNRNNTFPCLDISSHFLRINICLHIRNLALLSLLYGQIYHMRKRKNPNRNYTSNKKFLQRNLTMYHRIFQAHLKSYPPKFQSDQANLHPTTNFYLKISPKVYLLMHQNYNYHHTTRNSLRTCIYISSTILRYHFRQSIF